MSVGFYNVFNFKQAILQEMEFQGWNLYDPNAPEPPATDFDTWSYYYRYRYYKDFQQHCVQLKPVLLPYNSIINAWKKQRCFVTGENYDELPENWLNETPWRWNYELFSDINYLPGEIEDSCVVDLGNCLSHVLTDEYDRAENYGEKTYYAEFYSKALSNYEGVTENVDFFNKLFDSDLTYKATAIAKYSLEDTFEVLMKYTNSDGSIASTNPIVYNSTERSSYPNFTTNRRLLRGKTTPRVVVNKNEYVLYMKFEQNLPGQSLPTFRYIPIYNPYIDLSTSTNASIRDSAFGFIPFNQYQTFVDPGLSDIVAYSLPPIAFSTNNQIPTINLHAPHEYWDNPCIVPELSIKQYFYLAGVPIVSSETTDGILTPWNELEIGEKPIITGGENEETGETIGPSGDIIGGSDVVIDTANPGSKRKFALAGTLKPPGFYGGIYIPLYRQVAYIRNPEEMEKATKEMNDSISALVRNGKLDSLVESFITYTGFVNDQYIGEDGLVYNNKYRLPAIELQLSRPLYLGGFDSAGAYTPKNKKLFNYPYMSFEINGYGQTNELKLENWASEKPTICMTSKFQPGAGILVFPKNYSGVLYNYDAGVTGQPLPILSYTKDDYKNEYNACINSRTAAVTSLAENTALGLMNSTIGATVGVASGANPVYGRAVDLQRGHEPFYDKQMGYSMGGRAGMHIARGIQGVSGALMSYHQGMREFESQLKDVENRPLSVANQNAAPSVPALMGDYAAPFIVWKSIRVEFAKKIDEFFSRYGYRVSRFGEVDIFTRPTFNFLKCSEARVKSKSGENGMTQDDVMMVKAILEKGITFWHDPTKIGNYDVSNPAPITNNNNFLNPTYQQ